MTERLVADIGGTHSRFALAGKVLSNIKVYDNAEYPGLAAILQDYLGCVAPVKPAVAAIAVASPVKGDRVRLTNLGWTFSIDEFRHRFDFDTLHVLNDFVAIALSIPQLNSESLEVIMQGRPEAGHPVAVLGPGTGLGVSALVPYKRDWIPIAGEGGHVTLAPATDEESRILSTIRAEFGHVSAERLLSGPGLSLLCRVVSGNDNLSLAPETITRLAVSGEDPVATRTLDHFLSMLATVAGNLALTLGAQGGVYLGGGILPRLGLALNWSRFRERFVDKGRYREYIEPIPVYLITQNNPALLGLKHYLETQGRG